MAIMIICIALCGKNSIKAYALNPYPILCYKKKLVLKQDTWVTETAILSYSDLTYAMFRRQVCFIDITGLPISSLPTNAFCSIANDYSAFSEIYHRYLLLLINIHLQLNATYNYLAIQYNSIAV